MEKQKHPPYGKVFLGLVLLTIIEVFASQLQIPKVLLVIILVSFAICKALLVAMFYMHLKFEKLLLTIIAIVPFVFSIILVLFVGFDI